MKTFRVLFFLVALTVAFAISGDFAQAAQVRCAVVHNQEIMSEIHRLELAKAGWENEPGKLNQLRLTLLQRLMTSSAVKKFDERVYNGHLLSLLQGQAKPSDLNLHRYVEGRLAVLEFLNLSMGRTLSPEGFLKDIESSRALRQRRAMKLLQQMDLTNEISRRSLDTFSAELFLATKGVSEKATDYIFKSADQRAMATWTRMFQEQLLERGLRRVIEEMPDPQLNFGEALEIKTRGFFRHKLFRFLAAFPAALPKAKYPILSEDLMVKVMLDGMPAHKKAIEAELAKEGNWTTYNRLRRLWTPLFAGVAMFMTYPAIYNHMQTGVVHEIEATLSVQREKARTDFQKGIDSVEAVSRYTQIQSIQQKTNRYLEMTVLLSKEWQHRDWEAFEVQAVANKVYGPLLTAEIRSQTLENLPAKVAVENVMGLSNKIEGLILQKMGLVPALEVIP